MAADRDCSLSRDRLALSRAAGSRTAALFLSWTGHLDRHAGHLGLRLFLSDHRLYLFGHFVQGCSFVAVEATASSVAQGTDVGGYRVTCRHVGHAVVDRRTAAGPRSLAAGRSLAQPAGQHPSAACLEKPAECDGDLRASGSVGRLHPRIRAAATTYRARTHSLTEEPPSQSLES